MDEEPIVRLDEDRIFQKWLEAQYPAHNKYDHNTLSEYERWVDEQRTAFTAGRKSSIEVTYELMGHLEVVLKFCIDLCEKAGKNQPANYKDLVDTIKELCGPGDQQRKTKP